MQQEQGQQVQFKIIPVYHKNEVDGKYQLNEYIKQFIWVISKIQILKYLICNKQR